MLPDFRYSRNYFYTYRDLSKIFFENYVISYITLTAREKNCYFGFTKDDRFEIKMEGKILGKTWLELPSRFASCSVGNYGLSENTFSGILTIDNRLSKDISKKLIPIIISSFKSRSSKLLNQFHGLHGRIFWENNFNELMIRDLKDLDDVMQKMKTIYPSSLQK